MQRSAGRNHPPNGGGLQQREAGEAFARKLGRLGAREEDGRRGLAVARAQDQGHAVAGLDLKAERAEEL